MENGLQIHRASPPTGRISKGTRTPSSLARERDESPRSSIVNAFHEPIGNRKGNHRTHSQDRRPGADSNPARSFARQDLNEVRNMQEDTYSCFVMGKQPSGIVLAEASPQQVRT